jgi:hypothetical protein
MVSYTFQKLVGWKFRTQKILFLAWEDPENEDAIPDFIEDDVDSKAEMFQRLIDQVLLLNTKVDEMKAERNNGAVSALGRESGR